MIVKATAKKVAAKKVGSSRAIGVSMELIRETKGTWVFAVKDDEDAAITQLYVRKTGYEGNPPQNIIVTLTEDV